MKKDVPISRSIKLGQKQAKKVMDERDKALKKRKQVLRKLGVSPENRLLVAEGDSWFDYLWDDILTLLESEHGYEVEDVAHYGDRIEEMAYSDRQLLNFTRTIDKLIENGQVPKAILLSGGGNDLAGDEFHMLLDHHQSSNPGLNEMVVKGVLEQRIRNAYIAILSSVTEVCERRLHRKIPILIHGYAHAVPDGRGYWIGGWLMPGPWLKPGFDMKGFEVMPENISMVRKLIDRFNEMLIDLTKLPKFSHVTHVDLRKTLKNDKTWKTWWENEIHPTEKGFKKVTKAIADVLENLPTPT